VILLNDVLVLNLPKLLNDVRVFIGERCSCPHHLGPNYSQLWAVS
jgi:hypothetical protein